MGAVPTACGGGGYVPPGAPVPSDGTPLAAERVAALLAKNAGTNAVAAQYWQEHRCGSADHVRRTEWWRLRELSGGVWHLHQRTLRLWGWPRYRRQLSRPGCVEHGHHGVRDEPS